MILCSFCLAILSPRPSTSPAATPFSAYVCLILGGVVCLGLGVWGVMLRDFQLMGWRGREGERGRASGGYRIGGEKRPSRWASKVFWSRKHRGRLFTTKKTPKVEWKLKRLQWSAGNSFFKRNCTVLHQHIEPQYLKPFYYKRRYSSASKPWAELCSASIKSLPLLLWAKWFLVGVLWMKSRNRVCQGSLSSITQC